MARARFPHPLTLLTGCILASAICSYLLPAGQYDRREDPVTGRPVVVAGTYHHVEQRPVGPFEAFVAIPKGLRDAASVVFLVFLVGGAFTVVDETGALRQAVGWLVGRLQHREALVIPLGTGKGRVRKLPSGKFEITVDAETPLDEWLEGLPALIRAAMA